MSTAGFDDLVVGAGMAGLTIAAQLAADGRRVLVVDAHDTPGGNAHTFAVGAYRFCAQVHYIFNCGEGEAVHQLLARIGLADSVRFHRLDPEGFDHIVVGGERYRVPNGLDKHRDRLCSRFPGHVRALHDYFDTITALGRELDRLPAQITWRDLLTAPLRFPHLLRYQRYTLQQLYDRLGLPARLQTVLAGQAGDYLLPPSEVSLLLHVALVRGYDRGAYYPERHFQHLVGSIADYIASRPGCELRLSTRIARFVVERGRVTGVVTAAGEVLTAARFVSNLDPQRTAQMIDLPHLPAAYRAQLRYPYSSGNLTLYLGVRDLDLRDHGFGSWNVWHYPHDGIDAIYRRQLVDNDYREPWLFMSTPTLHTDAPGLCPPGHQILELATSAPYGYWRRMRDGDRRAYNAEKKRVRDRMIEIVEERYVPGLSRHLAIRVMGTPVTNERFCGAPMGNAYGVALTPRFVGRARLPHATPIPNLWLANATAGYPSVAGTIRAGLELHGELSA